MSHLAGAPLQVVQGGAPVGGSGTLNTSNDGQAGTGTVAAPPEPIGTIRQLAVGRMLLQLDSGTVIDSVQQHRQVAPGGIGNPQPGAGPVAAPGTGSQESAESNIVVIPQAILIITHKPAVLRQVSRLLQTLLANRQGWTSSGGDGKVRFISPGYQEGVWKTAPAVRSHPASAASWGAAASAEAAACSPLSRARSTNVLVCASSVPDAPSVRDTSSTAAAELRRLFRTAHVVAQTSSFVPPHTSQTGYSPRSRAASLFRHKRRHNRSVSRTLPASGTLCQRPRLSYAVCLRCPRRSTNVLVCASSTRHSPAAPRSRAVWCATSKQGHLFYNSEHSSRRQSLSKRGRRSRPARRRRFALRMLVTALFAAGVHHDDCPHHPFVLMRPADVMVDSRLAERL